MAKKTSKVAFNYGGVVINLTKSKTQAAVQYTPEATVGKRGVSGPPPMAGFEVVNLKRNVDQKLDQLRARPEVAVGSHVWNIDGDEESPLIPTGNIYIEFQPASDEEQRDELLEELGLSIKERVGPDACRVAVSLHSPNPIKCVTLLQKKKKIIAVAEPELAALPADRAFQSPGGAFAATQWHLENNGKNIPIIDVPNAVFSASQFKAGADAKVRSAWAAMQSTGASNIKIAVIDTGFALDHPQLRGDGSKIKSPFNAVNRTGDVSPYVRYSDGSTGVASHGTSCAAVAAGAWDNQGILGVAPNARIIPIKLDMLTDESIRNAFEYALLNGADVISCSLGFPQSIPLSTYIFNYIRQVVQQGRNGRGLPIFIAAGNANPASNNQPRQISDFATHPDICCVTASNSLDQRSSYSFFGPNAFMCAPTNGDPGVGITTASCDLGDDNRSVALGYTSGFGGTSSAAPLAAGVCALMLSANPSLTVAQIRGIFAGTADKIGPAGTYNAQGHSQYYGFGRINALRAVQSAMQLQSGGGAQGQAPPPASGGNRGRVNSPTLNVRKGPGAGFMKVAELKQNALVNILERKSDGWLRIGVNQWVLGKYITAV